jgi:hypothetical protein
MMVEILTPLKGSLDKCSLDYSKLAAWIVLAFRENFATPNPHGTAVFVVGSLCAG